MKSLLIPAARGNYLGPVGFASATFVQVAGYNPTTAAHVSFSNATSQEFSWAGAIGKGFRQAQIYAWYLQQPSGSGVVELRLQARQGSTILEVLPTLTFAPPTGAPIPVASRLLLGTVPFEGPFQFAIGRFVGVAGNFNQPFRIAALEVTAE